MVAEEGPEIYIFDGDDEFAINESIKKVISHLGDENIADMNTTQLDGKTFSLPQLQDALATMPFLATKRLVILTHPTFRLKEKKERDEFLSYLSSEKPDAKLLLVEYDFLTNDKDRRSGHLNWLERWALTPDQAHRVYIRHHPQPTGGMMVKWIRDYVSKLGGKISTQAAVLLASQVGEDTRLASQEAIKLLTYVNFTRPVDTDDVEHLTPQTAKIGNFELVNAIRDRDLPKVQMLLHRSLQDNDPLQIFHSIVYQIRVLMIAREMLDEHTTFNDIPKSLKISYYPAKLALDSAPRFSSDFLDMIYHRLLDLEKAIKTGQMDADLALELLAIELTI